MEGSSASAGRRTLTPAVLASAIFTAACAVVAITFVAARGGLEMPIAPTGSPVAVASPVPSLPQASAAPATPPTAAPSPAATAGPVPSAVPSTGPTAAPIATPAPSFDPLTALPACPDEPGCYEYVVQRGDTLSGIASRYLIPVSTVVALNPELDDPGTIVVGRILYLGRDPFARLEPCPDAPNCALYVVRPGDLLSSIANRFGITMEGILALNPAIADPNAIYSGQVIRLPRPG